MQKLISRVCCLFLVVLVIAACLPFSAFAVDPVSAGVMANAFAQAIAAYGASNGVALTFDVASTDGIGETVHELWKNFREGTQSADDYGTLAAALFPDLYYKASSVVAGAADAYTVGYNISSTFSEEFDNFYNWLLSGPAEMTKVDNQYFEFSQAQIGPEATPIQVGSVNTGPFASQPLPQLSTINATTVCTNGFYIGESIQWNRSLFVATNKADVYFFYVSNDGFYAVKEATNTVYSGVSYAYINNANNTATGLSTFDLASRNGAYYYKRTSEAFDTLSVNVPVYSSLQDGLSALSEYLGNPSASVDTIGVKAYDNTGLASFPDTSDPNYDAVAKQIPSTYPWNDSLYGDGTGALTDVQAGAIAGSVDDAIAVDGVVDLAGTREGTDEPGTDDPPSDDPDDYVVPGLADIFPFCIPFDIYNFLSALAAAPVAPHFTASLDFPEAVGGTQTIDIDFDSPTWNQLAQLLRLLELLAFIIGLAFVTRSMFIRG